jgi:putative ATP-binding cassette transporter
VTVARFLLRQARWRLALSLVAGLAGGVGLAGVMSVTHRALTAEHAADLGLLPKFGVCFALFLLGSVLSEKLFIELSERMKVELRLKLARELLHAELITLERTGPERLWTALVRDVDIVTQFVCWLPNAFVNAAIVTGCYAYMAWLSPGALAFAVAFVLAAAAVYRRLARGVTADDEACLPANERLYRHLNFLAQGLKPLLQSRARRDDFLGGHFGPSSREVMGRSIRFRVRHAATERIAESMVLLGIAAQLFVLPRLLDLSLAVTVGLVSATLFSLSPLKTLLSIVPRTASAGHALDRIRGLGIELIAAEAAPPTPMALAPEFGVQFHDLALRDVVFAHAPPAGEDIGFAIGPVSLEMAAGDVLFLVGGNGSGKTTLAKLLCGLYRPAAGEIAVNGRAVPGARRSDYRELFATVFADDPLFRHTLGVPAAEVSRRAPDLLRAIRLDAKVAMRGTEFSTIDLSQGQRRRLLLLGALLEDRPVFVFDEWASDQDPDFRRVFYDQILPGLRHRGKAVLVISQDDRFYGRADRIVKLDAGRAVPYEATPPVPAPA